MKTVCYRREFVVCEEGTLYEPVWCESKEAFDKLYSVYDVVGWSKDWQEKEMHVTDVFCCGCMLYEKEGVCHYCEKVLSYLPE